MNLRHTVPRRIMGNMTATNVTARNALATQTPIGVMVCENDEQYLRREQNKVPCALHWQRTFILGKYRA